MLKKIFVMLLAFLFCLTMGSCASQPSDPQDTETERDPNQESTSESEEESETEFTDQPVDDSELVPAYEGTKAEITHTDIYNDCILVTVQDTTKAEYETYLETLLSFSNYTEIVSPREILGNTGNLASMYTKQTAEGNYLINVLWIPEEKSVYGVGEVKITVEPLHDTDLSVFDPASATTGSVESLLIQIGVDEYGAIGSVVEGAPDQNKDSGMSYVYRLSDGSFLVMDGGGDGFGTGDADREQASRIYRTLDKYKTTDEIVIAAWYITHPHTDHMGAFMAFSNIYLSNPNYKVSMEKVICNLPNISEQTLLSYDGFNYALGSDKMELYNTGLENLRADGVDIYKAHVGQVYYIRNVTVEILFTYDLFSPALPESFFVSDAYGAYVERIYNNDEVSFTLQAWSEKDMQYQALDQIYKGVMPEPNADGRYTLTIPAGYTYTSPDGKHTYTASQAVSFTFRKNSAEFLFFANYDKADDVAILRERHIDSSNSTKAVYVACKRNNFTNTFSLISQMTVHTGENVSHTALWTGDATCYSIASVNKMYGAAMKSDFVQVPHHGLTQMDSGSSHIDILKHTFEIEINHFFGAASGVSQEMYPQTWFPQAYNSDGSYGYVRAKYVLWPSYLKGARKFIDGEPGDSLVTSDSYTNTWNPLHHLQVEAQAQGGNVYVGRCFLTVFALGDTVTVTEDHTLFTSSGGETEGGNTITSAEDFATMDSKGSYVLGCDITVTDPTGALFAGTFQGTLDGQGHTITIVYDRLNATAFEAQSGFVFTNLKNATVKNLTVAGVRMTMETGSGQYGILARRASGTVLIDNVHIVGAVLTEALSSNANVGGFFGDTDAESEITIQNSSFKSTINAAHNVGGFIARAGTSSAKAKSLVIENCTLEGTLTTTGARLGGFLAQVNVSDTCLINHCENRATVTGNTLAGGFVGLVTAGSVTLNGCGLASLPTADAANAWVASGEAEVVNCQMKDTQP
ncbi:MAG: hypothetical protein IKA05_04545 [Clostridia bacterium]|nr:hypothetical protein [Clostridia bacterium]